MWERVDVPACLYVCLGRVVRGRWGGLVSICSNVLWLGYYCANVTIGCATPYQLPLIS